MGIPQARVLEWVAMPFSRGSSNPGIKPRSPTLQVDSLLSEPSGKPDITNQLSHSVRSDSVTPWTAAHQASLSITNSQSYSNSCPSHWWCHPTISSSVVAFSSCLQSFPASGSFPMSWFFISGGQSIGVSASTSVLPMNTQDWFPLGWTGWTSLQFKQGTLKSLLQHHSPKASIFWCSAFFRVQLSHPYMTTGKTISLTRWTFVGKVMSLLFNMLSRLVIFPSFWELSTVYCDPHSQRLWHSQQSRNRCFSGISCFFDDPADIGNLISGSSTFSKTSLNIWKFMVHV